MPRQTATSIENNFSGGLKTEFTGLNFPENSCTDTDNCVFSLTGEVSRRLGIEFEANAKIVPFSRASKAMNSYKWNNAGGDGLTQIYVSQIGSTLYFYKYSSATLTLPISQQLLVSTVSLATFRTAGSPSTYDQTECQFTDGNGYLFVFHPNLEPFYCTFSGSTVTAVPIPVTIRDFYGIPETNVSDDLRPAALSNEHKYNLVNQGWTAGTLWSASSLTNLTTGIASFAFTVASGITGITGGQAVYCAWQDGLGNSIGMSGTVTSYVGTTLTINITSTNISGYFVNASGFNIPWSIVPVNVSYIDDWFSATGNYPSNSDVWWRYKNSSNVFDPATTLDNVTISGPAPKGHFILAAFYQQRSAFSSIPSLTDVTTSIRPKTGAWFAGRVWYAGVDASFPAAGDMPFSSWTENIYFSQIVTGTKEFGKCYQTNDPTSEDLFDLLPSDGGVINIQGAGSVYKLFPIQNGMLVFASNGIWFITGSQGIGFTANDYTITKISGIKCISSTSFVDVQGFPLFWNEDGIYNISPNQNGLAVNSLTVNSISSFYNEIPLISKLYARGDYNPITYIVQWAYRSESEAGVTSRYEFDRILNFNVNKNCFYPWTIETGGIFQKIHDVKYISQASFSVNTPPATFKYFSTYLNGVGTYSGSFAEEKNNDYLDWNETNYESFFTTGYKLHGNAIRKFQPQEVFMFSRADEATAYKFQGIWDFASSGNSGKITNIQLITNALTNFGMIYRKHRLRGHGLSLQLKIQSVDGLPFKIMGWTIWENSNASV